MNNSENLAESIKRDVIKIENGNRLFIKSLDERLTLSLECPTNAISAYLSLINAKKDFQAIYDIVTKPKPKSNQY